MPLALQAFFELLRYDWMFKRHGFNRVYEGVRRTPVAQTTPAPDAIARVGKAVTLAACFYWKPMLCLPRSVVATRLLRRKGVRAQMLIGYQPSPFMSHAWVEVEGKIVYDTRGSPEPLLVLDRL